MHSVTAIRKVTKIADKFSYVTFIPYFFMAYLTSLNTEVCAFISQTNKIKKEVLRAYYFSLCLVIALFPDITSNSCMNINSFKGLLSEESNTMQILTK